MDLAKFDTSVIPVKYSKARRRFSRANVCICLRVLRVIFVRFTLKFIFNTAKQNVRSSNKKLYRITEEKIDLRENNVQWIISR